MTDRNTKVFVDSNVLIYLIDNTSSLKKEKVENLLLPSFLISTQVVAENISVCFRKLKLDKATTYDHARGLLKRFSVVTITPQVLLRAFDIALKYSVSHWDSIIIATALTYNCNTLFSEDMQHNLKIENVLQIINPFKA